MLSRRIEFTATTVKCNEATDWEIIQVNFDTVDYGFDEVNRTSPYLMASVCFEFSSNVQIEYYDGKDYSGDSLDRIQLWQHRVLAISGRGHEFDIGFDLSVDAFRQLRQHLRVLLRHDCFQK